MTTHLADNKGRARRGRHGWCHYCGKASRRLTWDHVVPRSVGGPDLRWNLVHACEDCNLDKGNKDRRDHCADCAAIWARFESERVESAADDLRERFYDRFVGDEPR